jgi:UDP-glucose 4-epimerase
MNILLLGHGYVGSYLRPYLERAGHAVTVCDQNLERLTGVAHAIHNRYQDLTIADLACFDAILWFAGHSSVPMSQNDPDGATANNCFDLLQLAKRKRVSTRLIYASTASVYSVAQTGEDDVPPALDETETRLNPVNPYDASKVAFDALASCFASNVTGLRLGTVSGASPILRRELVFNAMNLSAMNQGLVRVSNAHAHRTILFLSDLAHYVGALLRSPQALPRILNVGSFNVSFGELALIIATHHGVPVELGEATPTYSFRTNWRRIIGLAGEPKAMSIAEQCAMFAGAMEQPRKALAS